MLKDFIYLIERERTWQMPQYSKEKHTFIWNKGVWDEFTHGSELLLSSGREKGSHLNLQRREFFHMSVDKT